MKFIRVICYAIVLSCFNQSIFVITPQQLDGLLGDLYLTRKETRGKTFWIRPSVPRTQYKFKDQYYRDPNTNSQSLTSNNRPSRLNIDPIQQLVNQNFFVSACYALLKLFRISIRPRDEDRAPNRQRIHNGLINCDELNERNYIKEDVHAAIDNCNWGDFSCDGPDCRNWPDYAKDSVFGKYSLYRYESFREFLCSLGRGSRFIELYEDIMNDPEIEKIADTRTFSIKEFALEQMVINKQILKNNFFLNEIQPKIIDDYQKKLEEFKKKLAKENERNNEEFYDEEEDTSSDPDYSSVIDRSFYPNSCLNNALKTRINAIKSYEKQKEIIYKKYELSPTVKHLLEKLQLDQIPLKDCSGNILQQQLHCESLTIIQDAANESLCEFQEIKDISEVAAGQGYAACVLNKQNEIKMGFCYADAGHCILAFAKGVKNEALRDVCNKAKTLHAILRHPIGTVKALGENVIYALNKIARIGLKCIAYTPDYGEWGVDLKTLNEQEKLFDEAFKGEFKKLDAIKKQLVTKLNNSTSAELCEDAGHILYKIVMFKYETPITSKILKTSAKVIKPADKLKKLGSVGKQAAQVIGLNLKKGAEKVARGIETIKQYPYLLSNSTTIVTSIEKAIEYSENFNNYLNFLKASIIRRGKDLKYNSIFDKYKLPPGFVPVLVDGAPLIQETNGAINKIVDILGNQWKICKKTGNVSQVAFSKLGQKTIGWTQNAEGIYINNAKDLISKLSASNKHLQHFIDLEKEIALFEKMFNNLNILITDPITKKSLLLQKLNFRHYLNLDIRKEGLITGFHHDFKGFCESEKLVKFINPIKYKKGFYGASHLELNGIRTGFKSFFPSSWPRILTAEKIIESLNDVSKEVTIGSSGRWIVEGYISEGVKIRTVVTDTAKHLSSYVTKESLESL